jgi:dCMP deaminase
MSSEPSLPQAAEPTGRQRQRLSRPDLFMSVAAFFGQRSSCSRAEVGCIATLEGRIVASGYVGAPHGQPHCLEVGCDMEGGHCVRTVHAEANLIAWAARVGTSLLGTTVWCTHSPCRNCALLLANAGVKDLHWHHIYDEDALDLMFDLGIKGNRQLIPGVPIS